MTPASNDSAQTTWNRIAGFRDIIDRRCCKTTSKTFGLFLLYEKMSLLAIHESYRTYVRTCKERKQNFKKYPFEAQIISD
jgi:hypothetical protein